MPAPRYKTHRYRKMKVRVPGGSTHIHYRERNPRKAHCATCGGELHGIPRVRASALQRMPKTYKRPERPYGGQLCSACMREEIRRKITAS